MVGGMHEERYAMPSRLGMKIVSREADGTVCETETNVIITETLTRAVHGDQIADRSSKATGGMPTGRICR